MQPMDAAAPVVTRSRRILVRADVARLLSGQGWTACAVKANVATEGGVAQTEQSAAQATTGQPVGHPHAATHGWPALIGLIAVGAAYALVSAALTLGPPWLLLLVLLGASMVMFVTRLRGLHHMTRHVGLSVSALAALMVAASAILLLQQLLRGGLAAEALFQDAGLLWAANVVVFALVYWELDGGGPAHRLPGVNVSSEFVFPQQAIGGGRPPHWTPDFIDYLFLAFNTSTAFSPTDTMIVGRRAKGLMMAQALVSLVTIAVLAARAVNTLPG
jgi:hypothetical protein